MYSIKMEQLDEIFVMYQDSQKQMMRQAMRKRERHRKKIVAIEKRYPVFGLLVDKDGGAKLRAG